MLLLNNRGDNFTLADNRRGITTQTGMKAMGNQLAYLRKERGISQKELANRLGVAQPNISNYERGTLRLNGELIIKLTEILGVSADALLGLENGATKRGPTPKLQHQLDQLGRLPRAKQRFVSEMLTGLLQQATH